MLAVLGGLAEFERELIRSRTDEGRKRAKVRGVKFGRKLKLTPYQRQEALARRAQGEPLVEIALDYFAASLGEFLVVARKEALAVPGLLCLERPRPQLMWRFGQGRSRLRQAQ
jgi:Resolvase, N terminal domain